MTRPNRITRRCQVCGAPFSPTNRQVANGQGHYCTRACANFRSREMAIARFWSKPDKTSSTRGCWLFPSVHRVSGYGQFSPTPRQNVLAHRFAWEITHGPIPDGIDVLHECDVRNCVNPAHLWLGTNDENMADMVAKGRAARGNKNPRAALDEAKVRAIRAARAAGVTAGELALLYGVHKNHIQRVVSARSWAHIE